MSQCSRSTAYLLAFSDFDSVGLRPSFLKAFSSWSAWYLARNALFLPVSIDGWNGSCFLRGVETDCVGGGSGWRKDSAENLAFSCIDVDACGCG